MTDTKKHINKNTKTVVSNIQLTNHPNQPVLEIKDIGLLGIYNMTTFSEGRKTGKRQNRKFQPWPFRPAAAASLPPLRKKSQRPQRLPGPPPLTRARMKQRPETREKMQKKRRKRRKRNTHTHRHKEK